MTAAPGAGAGADTDDGGTRRLNPLGRVAFWAFLLIVIVAPMTGVTPAQATLDQTQNS